MPIMVCERGHLHGKRFVLPQQGAVHIGRDTRCQIQIRDLLASRVHCVISNAAGPWVIEDRSSSNGTFVNGAHVSRHTLEPGDLIEIGDSAFSFYTSKEDKLVGQTINGYRLEVRLGRGAMGTVYRARQLSLERHVALKILAPSLTGDPDFVASFEREAKAAARLNHPHVVAIHDSGEADGHRFIAMEYLPGGTVDQQLYTQGRFEPERTARMGLEALDALAFAEARHIVHRDIKPGNLLLTAQDQVKLCDLGIALDLRRPQMGAEFNAAGSPSYMAPEQVRGTPVDHRADLYALGATLYHMLSGSPPFAGSSIKEVLAQKLRGEPAPLSRQAPGIPPRLTQVVEKLMRREPNDRYASAQEAAKALKAAMNAPRQRAHAAPTGSPARAGAPARRGTPAGRLAAFIIVPVVLAAGVIYISLPRSPSAPPPTPAPPAARAPESPAPAPVVERTAPIAPPSELMPRQRPDDSDERATQARITELADRARAYLQQGLLSQALLDLAAMRLLDASSEAVAALEREIDAVVSSRLDAAAAEVDAECAARRFGEARRMLTALGQELPAEAAPRIAQLESRIAAAERNLRDALAAVTALEDRVLERAAHLAFDDVSPLLEEYGRTHPGHKEEIAPLRARLEAGAAVWRTIQEALQQAIKARRTQNLTFRPDPLLNGEQPSNSYRILELKGPLMTLQAQGAKDMKEVRAVFDLERAALAALCPEEGALTTQVQAQGLDLLLHVRAGRSPAAATAPGEPGAAAAASSEPGAAASPRDLLWARARRKELAELTATLDPLKAEHEWLGHVAREAAVLLAPLKDSPDMATELGALFVVWRREHLARGPLDSFFHAKEVRAPARSPIQLTYDFTDAGQLADFIPRANVETTLRHVPAQNALELQGEVRFLGGNPFRDLLAISGNVLRCNTASPNVNVALWTLPEDRATPELQDFDIRQLGRLGGGVRCDYVVCGMGYHVQFDLQRGQGGRRGDFLRGLGGLIPEYLRSPVLVIMGGAHGTRAAGVNANLLWETSSEPYIRQAFPFTLEVAKGTLKWQVGNRAVPTRGVSALSVLQTQLSGEGSLSLFTNNQSILFGSLRIQGMLRPEWTAEEAERRAREELARLQAR